MQRRTDRSTEAPMDYEYTHRKETTPVWMSPSKRLYNEINPPTPTLSAPGTPSRPTFGHNTNTPFLFNIPAPQTPHPPAWVPPPNFSPEKAFPQPELHDVEMSESSPGSKLTEQEQDGEGNRPVSGAALRRVYKRRNQRDRSRLGRRHARVDDGESSGEESGEEGDHAPLTQKTTNHYTLNMAGPIAPQSDLPFRLLGYVQFVFNAALALLGIYLLVLFVLTVSRDVEYRVAEYSMDIVQDIAQCNLAYKANLCEKGTVPAMAAQCAAWETCMNRDPTKVGRAKVSMEVIGETVNSFVEPISWKTLAFVISSLAFFTLFINSLPSFFRPREIAAPPPRHIPSYPIPPAIPYHPSHGYLPPPEWSNKPWKRDEVEVAPRRRRLEDGQVAKVK
ncbi:Di-sulfide bridge nucleocytoplasmic transport domain-containing protein [Dichomitus squalens]|uniref:Di-sulfide bridge nucleocytoplasmic transport domain-containing protein n=2 Tax=Dichomitus squalens TaxID=114155 RepID=A0A4Q9PIU3_9APHY|nr:uncharacterized protein DICSQDRAFT_156574 [Dichomitus squalens LYAD-421 SS1]EJF58786.1 hypothetical protein DICSQDRAFT_156574 [Dichomitus squalens LYAD-421 SS1]TBU30839.1 Di-sulfide bridge nucleocytoplasmic transport domain-containing protein [Dichomitus squalens]TBU43123.1 Di-sulfide bridge nucleocytoplasmic transport domain-containing protein [Dichomitus squalens]TBU53987.1 Di-sulfide bridge nucleocytoplasmic transport domain-containing protein [Dichomitus squalens]